MVVGVVGRTLAGLLKSTAPAAGVGVGIGAGAAAGGSAVSVAMMPFNAVNNFLGSGFFGYGMIIGERYAYQNDWPKIQERLEKGEKIFDIMHEYTGTFSAVMMAEAKIIMQDVSEFVHELMTTFAGGTDEPSGEQAAGIAWFIKVMQDNNNNPDFVGPPAPSGTQETFQDDRSIEAAEEERLRQIEIKRLDKLKSLDQQKDTNKQIDQIIKNAPPSKRKAGQSQIQERNRLIQQISTTGKNYSKMVLQKGSGHVISKAVLKELQALQIKLAQLLTRYQF